MEGITLISIKTMSEEKVITVRLTTPDYHAAMTQIQSRIDIIDSNIVVIQMQINDLMEHMTGMLLVDAEREVQKRANVVIESRSREKWGRDHAVLRYGGVGYLASRIRQTQLSRLDCPCGSNLITSECYMCEELVCAACTRSATIQGFMCDDCDGYLQQSTSIQP